MLVRSLIKVSSRAAKFSRDVVETLVWRDQTEVFCGVADVWPSDIFLWCA